MICFQDVYSLYLTDVKYKYRKTRLQDMFV
jgi:hypothetical protein